MRTDEIAIAPGILVENWNYNFSKLIIISSYSALDDFRQSNFYRWRRKDAFQVLYVIHTVRQTNESMFGPFDFATIQSGLDLGVEIFVGHTSEEFMAESEFFPDDKEDSCVSIFIFSSAPACSEAICTNLFDTKVSI